MTMNYRATVGFNNETRENIYKDFETKEEAIAYAYRFVVEHPKTTVTPDVEKISPNHILGYIAAFKDGSIFWAVPWGTGYRYYEIGEDGKVGEFVFD